MDRTVVSAQTATHLQVLIVEDEEPIASFVSLYLNKAGYETEWVASGSKALERALSTKPALVVLDLGLPDIDGIEVCRRLRERSEIPVLILTARDEDVDKIVGLEVGADDYLTKPFNPRELVARVKSILRRAQPASHTDQSTALVCGDLVIDESRREAKVAGEEVQLSPKEFDLLWKLLQERGRVLSRDELLKDVWGYLFSVDTRTVDVHVRQLRQKLKDACPITTVWGVGYKIAADVESAPSA